MLKSLWILMLGFSLPVIHTHAQHFPDIKFQLLNTANGLPTNQITSIFQDSRGLMWFGTESHGLLRYDGKKTKAYFNNNRFAPNYTGQVCEDRNGWLWVTTLSGLYHFDPVSENTIIYRHNPNDNGSIASDEPTPFVDSRGRLWLSTRHGLQQFNAKLKKFINYRTPPIEDPTIQKQFNNVTQVVEDSKHRLWVGSAYGLYKIDTLNQSLIPYYTGHYCFATNIFETASKKIFVSFFGGGLKEFDPETGHFTERFVLSTYPAGINEWKDQNNNTWLCFLVDDSFVLLNTVTYQSRRYVNDNIQPFSFKGLEPGMIYKDHENRLWINTSEGINVVDEQQQHFTNKLLYPDIDKYTPNSFGTPKALVVFKEQYLMSVWWQRGLFEYDKWWKLIKRIPCIPPGSASSLSRGINTIQLDEEGSTWYGTDSGLIQKAGNHFKCFIPGDSFPILEDRYRASQIVKRKDGRYWSIFPARGVYVFEPKAGRFIKNCFPQINNRITATETDNTGRLFVGTSNGIYAHDERVDSFVRIPIKHFNADAEKNYNFINQMIFDDDNICWIGTKAGLIKFTPATGRQDFIGSTESATFQSVTRVFKDTTGIVWMVSTTALIAYDPDRNTFHHYTAANGLPVNFIGEYGTFKLIDDSTVAMGSRRTLTTFNPYRLLSEKKSSSILFTDISIDGQRKMPRKSIHNGGQLLIPAGSKQIFIHFSLINYAASQQNKLYYTLSQGEEEEWIETKDGDIMLLNLAPGEYDLRVKGTNTNLLNAATGQMTIIIKPFWYQTMLFKIAALIAITFAIYFFVRWRVRSVKFAATLKQKITETEMAALKAQMNPHFMFNCINSIDAFIHNNDKYNATLYLNKFAKLLRNILDSSKQNMVSLSKDTETLKMYLELEELRNEGKFKTELHITQELLENDYKVPPLIIQPFIENAILHGLRNRPGNNGSLQINIRKVEEFIEYSIQDNGIGRKAAGKISQNKQFSYGMQLSSERIRLFNNEAEASVRITDLETKDGPAGTLIIALLIIN